MAEPPPSLDELRRQRRMIADHLAWLDREIAARQATGATPVAAPAPLAAAPSADPLEGRPSPADPDAILEQYRVAPTNVTRDVRRGCLLYFVLGSVLLAALVWLLYIGLRTNGR